MTSEAARLRRVIAARANGEKLWKAAASDNVVIGKGIGYSWQAAVSEAVREVDEKRARMLEQR